MQNIKKRKMSQSGADDNADNSGATSTTHLKALKLDCCANDPDNIVAKTLSDFNDDCLEEIFKYLNFSDQFSLAQTCTRLRYCFVNFNKNRYRKLNLIEPKDLDLIENEKLSLLGHFVNQIIWKELCLSGSEDFLNNIVKFCKNVNIFMIICVKVSTNQLNKIFSGIDKIVVLRLSCCALSDDHIVELRKLHCLKSLDLSDNYSLTGKYINTLSQTIEILRLLGCSKLKVDNMSAFCESLTNLKELNLIDCFYEIREIDWGNHFKNLEILEINSSCIDFGSIAKLPNLKGLSIVKNSELRNLSVFVLHKAEQLKQFKICGEFNVNIAQQISQLHALRILSCPRNFSINETAFHYFCNLKNLEEIDLEECFRLTNTSVMRLVLSCSKLKRINLRDCCSITQILVFDLIKKLKEQIKLNPYQKYKKELIVITVSGTRISKCVLNHPEYVAAKDILRIEFSNHSVYKIL